MQKIRNFAMISGEKTALGRLMQDFFCTDPDAMNYKKLADRAKYFKHDEKGVKTMCKAMEALCNDIVEDAVAEAKQDIKIETSLRMIQKKMSLDLISELSGLPIAEVKALAESKSA